MHDSNPSPSQPHPSPPDPNADPTRPPPPQSFLFAMLCGAHMLVLRIIQELWQSSGGVFNVDEVLQTMVLGLEEELEMRLRGQADAYDADPAVRR